MMVRCVMLHCVVSLRCGLSCFVMWQYVMICCVTLSCVAVYIHTYIYIYMYIYKLWHVMLRCVMVCYGKLCYDSLAYVMLCHVMSCYVMWC